MCLYGLSSWPLQTPNVSLVFKPVFQSVLVQALNRAGFKPLQELQLGSVWGKPSSGGNDTAITEGSIKLA